MWKLLAESQFCDLLLTGASDVTTRQRGRDGPALCRKVYEHKQIGVCYSQTSFILFALQMVLCQYSGHIADRSVRVWQQIGLLREELEAMQLIYIYKQINIYSFGCCHVYEQVVKPAICRAHEWRHRSWFIFCLVAVGLGHGQLAPHDWLLNIECK